MRRIFLITAILAFISAYSYGEENKAINKSPFAFVQGFFMGDDYVQYQSDLAELKNAYKNGKISKEDYLEETLDLEKRYNENRTAR